MSETEKKPVVNIADLKFFNWGVGDRYAAKHGFVNFATGTDVLGCVVQVVPPGKATHLFTAEHSREELCLILAGSGEYHVGDKRYPIRKDDVVVAPEGNSNTRYEIVNTGATELQFIAVANQQYQFDLARLDAARRVIESYIKVRWSGRGSPYKSYDFDGRVLLAYDYEFEMLVTFDRWANIWVNGIKLAGSWQDSDEARIEGLVRAEQVAGFNRKAIRTLESGRDGKAH